MLREDAIRELKILKEDYWDDDGYGHETKQYDDTMLALDMAIKALEQEYCEDAISRKAVLCHNENHDYAECDQFVCSNCGIELQDWYRVERDEDDDDVTYHEYEFKFCPNCGARIDKCTLKYTDVVEND